MTAKELRELHQRRREICGRIREMANTIRTENRQRNEQEEGEYTTLTGELQLIDMKLRAQEVLSPERQQQRTLAEADEVLRRGRDERFDVTVRLQREIMDTTGLADTGIIPIQEREMLDPLRAGLIWNKMGIKIESGLAGTLRWPLHTKANASWEGETTRVADSKIDFRALTMQGQRVACAVPVSNTELNESAGVVARVVTSEMPAAVSDLINSSMLTLVKEFYDTKSSQVVEKTVAGPFAQKVSGNNLSGGCEVLTIAEQSGAYKDIRKTLLEMKAKVYGAGIAKKNPGYVMNENTKVLLEDTKVDAGSGRFVCENDMVLGYPVFTSNELPDGVIGFGDWSYQAAGFFGQTSMTIDPYTLARQHSTDFVLNMKFGTATLRKEAFVLAMTSAAKTALVTEIKALGTAE